MATAILTERETEFVVAALGVTHALVNHSGDVGMFLTATMVARRLDLTCAEMNVLVEKLDPSHQEKFDASRN